MKREFCKSSAILTFVLAVVLFSNNNANARYSTGYGNMCGAFGLAVATQNIYDTT